MIIATVAVKTGADSGDNGALSLMPVQKHCPSTNTTMIHRWRRRATLGFMAGGYADPPLHIGGVVVHCRWRGPIVDPSHDQIMAIHCHLRHPPPHPLTCR